MCDLFQVEFKVPGKQINLETKNCRLRDGTMVPCVNIEVSMSYDGIRVPDSIGKYFRVYILYDIQWISIEYDHCKFYFLKY